MMHHVVDLLIRWLENQYRDEAMYIAIDTISVHSIGALPKTHRRLYADAVRRFFETYRDDPVMLLSCLPGMIDCTDMALFIEFVTMLKSSIINDTNKISPNVVNRIVAECFNYKTRAWWTIEDCNSVILTEGTFGTVA